MSQKLTKTLCGIGLAVIGVIAGSMLMSTPAYAARTIDDGIYTIQLDNVTTLEIKNGSSLDGALAQTYNVNNTNAQIFKIEYRAQSDAYTIQNLKSGKYLSAVKDSKSNEYTKVAQYNCEILAPQLWKIENHFNNGDVSMDIKNVASQSYLQSGVIYKDNTDKIEYERLTHDMYFTNSERRLFWLLNKFETGQCVPDGNYYIQCHDTNKVLDIQNASKGNDINLRAFPFNGTKAQQFTFKYNKSTQSYSIINVNSGLALERKNNNKESLQIWQYKQNTNRSQGWKIYKNGLSGNFLIISDDSERGFEVGDTYGVTCPKLFGNFNDNTCERRVYNDVPTLWNIYPVNKYQIADGTYHIYSLRKTKSNSGYMGKTYFSLDIKNGSKKNKANIQLYKNNNTLAQSFIIQSTNQGYYTITNVASGKVLDVANASKKKGANVWQYEWNGTYAQQWKIEFDKNGYATISSRLTPSKVLDIANASYKNGTNVRMWDSNNTNAQRWIIMDQVAQ